MTPAGGVLPKVKAVQTPQGSPPAIFGGQCDSIYSRRCLCRPTYVTMEVMIIVPVVDADELWDFIRVHMCFHIRGPMSSRCI